MSLSLVNDLESMEEIQELLRTVQLIFEVKIASKAREGKTLEDIEKNGGNGANSVGCSCSSLMCSCCAQIKVLKFNDNCE